MRIPHRLFGVYCALLLLAALPSIWPDRFSILNPLKVDTDPENMLAENEVVRIFHNQIKKEMLLLQEYLRIFPVLNG